MAYTDYLHLSSEELTTLRDELVLAKTKLLKGSMAESVIIDGNQISYSRIDIPQLNIAISEIHQAISHVSGSSDDAVLTSFCVVHGGKGL